MRFEVVAPRTKRRATQRTVMSMNNQVSDAQQENFDESFEARKEWVRWVAAMLRKIPPSIQ